MKHSAAEGKVSMRLLNSEEAKKFMAEAGADFESNARRLIREDHAAIKQMKTPAELSDALGTIAAAVLQREITAMEANGALALLGQLLRTARKGRR
jgi:hypothetical protein